MPMDDYELFKKEQAEGALNRPLRGIITSVQPEKETVNVDCFGTGGSPSFAIRHPYMGMDSWLRVCPEVGTPVLVQQRGDLQQQEIWGYVSNNLTRLVRKSIVEKTYPYRVLRAGEIELQSSGKSSVFLSRYGDVEILAGVLTQIISQREMEHTACAPTFSRKLAGNQWSTLGHEERFGLVKRPSVTNPEFKQSYTKLDDGTFAVEYGRWLLDQNDKPLSSFQEGNVVDATGQFKKQTSTSKKLRLEHILASTSSTTLNLEVDEDLNIYLNNGNPQAKETKIAFGAQNEVSLSSKKWSMQISESGNLQFINSLIVGSAQIKFNSSDVQFGAAAIESAILGNQFVTSILTPLLSVLSTFFTTLSADPVAKLVIPVECAAAAAALTTLASISPLLASILSKQVKMTA